MQRLGNEGLRIQGSTSGSSGLLRVLGVSSLISPEESLPAALLRAPVCTQLPEKQGPKPKASVTLDPSFCCIIWNPDSGIV